MGKKRGERDRQTDRREEEKEREERKRKRKKLHIEMFKDTYLKRRKKGASRERTAFKSKLQSSDIAWDLFSDINNSHKH